MRIIHKQGRIISFAEFDNAECAAAALSCLNGYLYDPDNQKLGAMQLTFAREQSAPVVAKPQFTPVQQGAALNKPPPAPMARDMRDDGPLRPREQDRRLAPLPAPREPERRIAPLSGPREPDRRPMPLPAPREPDRQPIREPPPVPRDYAPRYGRDAGGQGQGSRDMPPNRDMGGRGGAREPYASRGNYGGRGDGSVRRR